MKLNKCFLSISLLLYIIEIIPLNSYDAKEILSNPDNYKNILCSGNGEPFYNRSNNEVTCTCKEGYTNEPSEENKETILLNFKSEKVDLLHYFILYVFHLVSISYI